MMEVYRAWLPVAKKYADMEESSLEPVSLGTILWKMVEKVIDFIKKWMGLLIIIIALVYLIISIRDFTAPTKQKDVYNAIGDMTIISGTAEETEAQNE